jgi:hypothetical protein
MQLRRPNASQSGGPEKRLLADFLKCVQGFDVSASFCIYIKWRGPPSSLPQIGVTAGEAPSPPHVDSPRVGRQCLRPIEQNASLRKLSMLFLDTLNALRYFSLRAPAGLQRPRYRKDQKHI